MITFEEVKELFKESIDATDTMNQALENLMQSIYQKGYNDALDKIREEIKEFAEETLETSSDCDEYASIRYCLVIIDRHIRGLEQ